MVNLCFMNKRFLTLIIIIVIIIVGVLIYTSQKSAVPEEKEVIKIGAILSLTGKADTLGEDMRNAINLALEKVNSNKQIVELIYEDGMCDPQEAVTAYKALSLKGVKLMIGAVCSPSTLAIAPLAEDDSVVLITPASSADSISQAGDFIFRNHVFSSQKAGKIADFANKNFHSVATLYDQTNDAYILGEQVFVEEFQGSILARESFQNGDVDFRTQLTKIKSKNPEAVFILALMPQSALILKQLEELAIPSQIISEDALATDEKFLDATENLSDGIIFSGSDFSRETNPEFWDLYTERFAKNPTIFAAQAYDSLIILSNIIKEKCKTGNPICVKDELYKVRDYPGVSGLTTFDENGDALKPTVIKTIKNGQFVPYEEE